MFYDDGTYDRKKFKVLCGNARLEVKEDEGEEA